MQSESIPVSPVTNLTQAARDFIVEVGRASERKKKALLAPTGLQIFLLYVRAHGYVPPHDVSGPITVQTVIGNAEMNVGGQGCKLPAGSVISIEGGVRHDVTAIEESVLLVTHSVRA